RLSTVAPGHPAVLPTPSAAARAGGAVLLVDDERAIRRALGVFLRHRGYHVLEAGGAGEALEIPPRQPVGGPLAHPATPGPHGSDFLEAARNRRPDVEVLLVTGRPEPRVAVEALRSGASEVLRKPLLFDEAEQALRRALERRDLRAKTL